MGPFRAVGPSIFGNANTPGRRSLGLAAASSLQSSSRGVGRAIAAASVQFVISLTEEAGGIEHCFSVSLALFRLRFDFRFWLLVNFSNWRPAASIK